MAPAPRLGKNIAEDMIGRGGILCIRGFDSVHGHHLSGGSEFINRSHYA